MEEVKIFLASLQNKGVKLSVENEKVTCIAPDGILNNSDRDFIKHNKAKILKYHQSAQQDYLISIAAVQDIPASYAQQRFWFIEQHSSPGPSYNVPIAFKINGYLNIQALLLSWQILVARHTSLRTYFEFNGKQLLQKVADVIPTEKYFLLEEINTISFDSGNVNNLFKSYVNRIFDLKEAPLFFIKVFKFSEKEYIFLLVFHHIIIDGWSVDILFRELSSLYNGYCLDEVITLSPNTWDYPNFSVWQRENITEEKLKSQIDFWRNNLSELEYLNLPRDFALKKNRSYSGEQKVLIIKKESSIALKKLAVINGSTLYNVLLAIFNIALYFFTGQEDICIGSPVAGRNKVQCENIVGLFVNSIIMRNKIKSSLNFIDFLKQVTSNSIEAFSNQDIPFEKLVDVLKPERNTDGNPLFQVMFTLQSANPGQPLSLVGCRISPTKINFEFSKFDLSVSFYDSGEGINGSFIYSTELFSEKSIDRLISIYRSLLEKIVSEPSIVLENFCSTNLGQEELFLFTRGIFLEGNRQHIFKLFEQSMLGHSENKAVFFSDSTLTYNQLLIKVNAVAEFLANEGVSVSDRVVVFSPPAPEVVVILLAILKLGAVYIPVDTRLPKERLNYILTDSSAKFLISDSSYEKPINLTVQVVDFEKLGSIDESKAILPINYQENAYIIYTSGTTGKPKGIIGSHIGLVNRLLSMQNAHPLTTEDKMLVKTSISFDVALWELLWPLMSGASLLFTDTDQVNDPIFFQNLLKTTKPTAFQAVPSWFQAIIQAINADCFNSVKHIFFGGEILSTELVMQCRKKLATDVQIYNFYAPSEVFGATSFKVDSIPNNVSAPIGKPIANRECHVINSFGGLCPVGVPGELYLGGSGLALGYLNQSELTEQKFIFRLFNGNHKKRLYKTGDRARWLSDGNLEVLGRYDDQVKLRGYRIELAEISAVLQQYPLVQQNIVLLKSDNDKSYLVAYIVGDEKSLPEIKKFSSSYLPEYMMPSDWIFVKTLPLTINGKVDKKILLNLSPQECNKIDGYVVPSTQLEQLLAEVWAKALHVEKIGTNDNFFSLGGDSILSIQIISQLNQHGINISTRDLFRYPTIKQLVNFFSNNYLDVKGEHPNLVEAKPFSLVDRELSEKILLSESNPENLLDIYPLTPTQRGIFLRSILDEKEHSEDYYVHFVWRIDEAIDEQRMKKTWQYLVDQEDVFRTGFIWQGLQQPLQCLYRRANLRWTFFTLAGNQLKIDEFLEDYFKNKKSKLNIQLAPLMEVILIQENSNCYYMIWLHHHLITDGWSVKLVMEKLSALYNSEDKFSDLQKISYRNYVYYILSLNENQKLAYWQQLLANFNGTGMLTEKSNEVFEAHSYLVLESQLTVELSQRIYSVAKRLQITPSAILQATWGLTLLVFSPENEILFGTTVSGRNENFSGLDRLIGLLVSTIPVRISPDWNKSISDYFLDIHQQLIESQANLNVDLIAIKKAARHLRDNDKLFNTLLVFANYLTVENQAEGNSYPNTLKAIPLMQYAFTKTEFDLVLFLIQGEIIKLKIDYNSQAFTSHFLQKLMFTFQFLLEQVLANFSQPLSLLNFVYEEECLKLLYSWQGASQSLLNWESLIARYQYQVAEAPDMLAVRYEGGGLNYAELDQRSTKLAQQIKTFYQRTQGCALPRQAVMGLNAVGLERVIGLFAIWKLSGIVLPLGTAVPVKRIAQLLADSHLALLIGKDVGVPGYLRIEVENQEAIEAEALERADVVDQARYLIYTSGSTGRPKGVFQSEKTLLNLAAWQACEDGGQRQRVSHYAAFGFDVSLQEITYALLNGHCLSVVPESARHSIAELGKFLLEHRITVCFLPTPILELLCEWGLQNDFRGSDLRRLVVGGEALRLTEPVKRFFKRYKQIRLCNQYGPTETHVASEYVLPEQVEEWEDSSPIGLPIWNARVYVLDNQRRLLPVGVWGELYIGGAGLALGYYENEPLTAERFIVCDIGEVKIRLYRTGDIVRWREDGELEYRGRVDEQVKIRGYRVELGEIEHVVQRYSGVTQAVVVLRREGEVRELWVYLVGAVEIVWGELKPYLEELLPSYMVPAGMTQVEQLSLTTNGKVDKQRLLSIPVAASHRPQTKPRDRIEFQLSNLWSELFGIASIGVEDDVFELGAHSLLIMRLLSKLNDVFPDVPFSLAGIYRLRTIEKMARFIKEKTYSSQHYESIIHLKPSGTQPSLFMIHPGGGTSLCYQPMVEFLKKEQPLLGIEAPLLIPGYEEYRTIEDLAKLYLSIIKTLQPQGPYKIGGWSLGGLIAYEMACQLKAINDKVNSLLLLDSVPSSYELAGLVPSLSDQEMLKNMVKVYGRYFDTLLLHEKERLVNIYRQSAKMARLFLPKQSSLDIFLVKATGFDLEAMETDLSQLKEHMGKLVYNGWEKYTSGKIIVMKNPGNHNTLLQGENLNIMMGDINKIL